MDVFILMLRKMESKTTLSGKVRLLEKKVAELNAAIEQQKTTIHYLGNENRGLVDKCNQLSNDLILTRATSTMTRENLEKLERWDEVERVVKKSWNNIKI
jgi:uncharacterized coiled-coil protein SlyX